MAVEGAMKCVKFLLFLFNFIFWLCGLALITLGILVQMAMHNSPVIQNASASSVPLVVIGIGVVIFFIAFFGCCGAWKESNCMLTMFSVLVGLIILTEIGAAIAGYVFRAKLAVIVKDGLTDSIIKYNNGTKDFREAVDKLQESLHCCGVNSSADWVRYKPDGNSVPESCCINVTVNCGTGTMHNPATVNQKGCQTAVEAVLKKNILWVVVAALVIAFLQVTGIIFACMLMRGIRSGYEVM
ncbi:CD63 antigen [Hypomesus transpacificus]|uniref:CD63 antigen n=1 Tax=Hypomesus transpacificus TaxID=137520 RepID=UPI001F0834C0|nr:CD63 antigen [Hypomesus transpacificus]